VLSVLSISGHAASQHGGKRDNGGYLERPQSEVEAAECESQIRSPSVSYWQSMDQSAFLVIVTGGIAAMPGYSDAFFTFV